LFAATNALGLNGSQFDGGAFGFTDLLPLSVFVPESPLVVGTRLISPSVMTAVRTPAFTASQFLFKTDAFTPTDSFFPSFFLRQSPFFQKSRVLIGTLPFDPSVTFFASITFSSSHPLPTPGMTTLPTPSITLSASLTPEPTGSRLPEGMSFSLVETFVESVSVSLTLLEMESVSEFAISLVSMSLLTISAEQTFYTKVATMTMGMTRFRSYVAQVISVIILIPTRSPLMVSYRLALDTPHAAEAMGSGMLIGIVSGSALVVAIIVAAIVFVIRSRHASGSAYSGSKGNSVSVIGSTEISLEHSEVNDLPDVASSIPLYEINDDITIQDAEPDDVHGDALYI
jgi:hypothetical protein